MKLEKKLAKKIKKAIKDQLREEYCAGYEAACQQQLTSETPAWVIQNIVYSEGTILVCNDCGKFFSPNNEPHGMYECPEFSGDTSYSLPLGFRGLRDGKDYGGYCTQTVIDLLNEVYDGCFLACLVKDPLKEYLLRNGDEALRKELQEKEEQHRKDISRERYVQSQLREEIKVLRAQVQNL